MEKKKKQKAYLNFRFKANIAVFYYVIAHFSTQKANTYPDDVFIALTPAITSFWYDVLFSWWVLLIEL